MPQYRVVSTPGIAGKGSLAGSTKNAGVGAATAVVTPPAPKEVSARRATQARRNFCQGKVLNPSPPHPTLMDRTLVRYSTEGMLRATGRRVKFQPDAGWGTSFSRLSEGIRVGIAQHATNTDEMRKVV